jgi:tetratricopeptide (TPR) repeat protein
MQNRIEIFRQMLEAEPDNAAVMFGLAKEYEKQGDHAEVIALLETYIASSNDEGNAYGVLANAYLQTGEREKAIETFSRGVDVALDHGHPSMANEYRAMLSDLADRE